MPAPDLKTLLDFETNFETATKSFLATDTGLTATDLFASLDQDTFVLPRLEVMFEAGEAIDPPVIASSTYNPTEYGKFRGTLTVRILTDGAIGGTNTTHRELRGKVRTSLRIRASNFTDTNLPYYEVNYLRPNGANYEVDGDIMMTILSYDVAFSFKSDAYPEAVFNNADAIYSLRRYGSYSGNAVLIRRSSDDAEVDVAFDSNNEVSSSSSISVVSGTVTETTLGDFINGTDAFVKTLYDQKGSNNGTQADTTEQPKIASSGSLITANGKTAILFDGDNDSLTTTRIFDFNNSASLFVVAKKGGDPIVGTDYFYTDGSTGSGSGPADTFGIGVSETRINFLSASTNVSNNTDSLDDLKLLGLIGGSSTTKSFVNGTEIASVTTPTNYAGTHTITSGGTIGGHGSASALTNFYLSEIVAFKSDQISNRASIENTINDYYNLYS